MFKMQSDKVKKEMIVTVGGFFKEEEGAKFIEEYNANVKSVVASGSKLIIDSTDLLTSKKEMVPVLEGCMQLYKSSGFKKVIFVAPASPTAAGQLKKIVNAADTSFEIVATLKEAQARV